MYRDNASGDQDDQGVERAAAPWTGATDPFTRDPLDELLSEDTTTSEAASARESALPLVRGRERDSELSVLDAHLAATREVPLLTADEEKALGRTMRESRSRLIEVLADVPLAVSVFVDAAGEAAAGGRRLSDVFQSPYNKIDLGVEHTGRAAGPRACYLQTAILEDALARLLVAEEAGSGATLRRCLGELFVHFDPAYSVLREALERCRETDTQVRAIETRSGIPSAQALAAGPPAQPGATDPAVHLRELRRRAGMDLDVLRERVAAADAAERRYRAARRRMIESNLRLAYYMSRKLLGHGLPVEDLVQEAVLGLMRAAEKFDDRLGWKFSTYACEWIWQGITRALAGTSRTIRVPAHMHDTILRLKRVSRELEQGTGRRPSDEEIAAKAGLPVDKVRLALESAVNPLSLSTPVGGDEESTLERFITDDEQADPSEVAHEEHVSRRVDELLSGLPEREAKIIRLRNGIGVAEPYTLEDIGRMLGITRERTRQLEARALEALRERVDPELLGAIAG